MYDLIIIGGGPAGLTAAVYAIRKRLNVLLLTKDLGGKTNYRLALPWVLLRRGERLAGYLAVAILAVMAAVAIGPLTTLLRAIADTF